MTEQRPLGSGAKPRLSLRLYVASEGPNSAAAVSNLRIALAQLSATDVELEIIDVLRDPQRGLLDGVLVTPMLLRVAPLPERRVVGNLRDQPVLLGLLSPAEDPHE